MDSLNSSTKSKPALKINFNQTLTTSYLVYGQPQLVFKGQRIRLQSKSIFDTQTKLI